MKIASVSAELAPFSKTGGLGEVARSLPVAIRELGHEVISITPLHSTINQTSLEEIDRLNIEYDGEKIEFIIWKCLNNNNTIYFLDNKKYFSETNSIYLTGFDNRRFLVFDIAVMELLKKINFKASVIQCHDWHTGLIPYFIKTKYKKDDFFQNTACVFTIHNLAFQFEKNWWEMGRDCNDNGISDLPNLNSPEIACVNFALRAIRNADLINAVSEKYAQEILTKEFGENLDIVLRTRRTDLYGIINGVDYETYNPATDLGLIATYDYNSIENKAINKLELQRIFGLPQNKNIPVIGMVSRITEQKGLDIIIKILDYVLDYHTQIVIMGIGDKQYTDVFNLIFKKKYKNFSFMPFDQNRETLVYAGSDLYLMPSRFEPCGLGQLISLRYGAIPIVRAVGGLADTIVDYNPITGAGNGFVFEKYDSIYLFGAIIRGLVNIKHKKEWKRLVQKSMGQTFSWELPAKKYVELFQKAIRNKKINTKKNI